MIPDFKTYIGESLFGSMSDKGRGETIKKEDKLQEIDFGDHCNFYFADRDFKVGDKDEFTYDEMKSLKFPDGWRLPKSFEFENSIYNDIYDLKLRIHKNIKVIDRIPDYLTIKSKQTGDEICFELNGNDRIFYWCDDTNPHGYPSVEVGWCPRNAGDYYVIGANNKRRTSKIRLVKDK